MGISIREFLRTRFVEEKPQAKAPSKINTSYYYFVLTAMRIVNRDSNPTNFQQDSGICTVKDKEEQPYRALEGYIRSTYKVNYEGKMPVFEDAEKQFARFLKNPETGEPYLKGGATKAKQALDEFERRLAKMRLDGEQVGPNSDAEAFLNQLLHDVTHNRKIYAVMDNNTDKDRLPEAIKNLIEAVRETPEEAAQGDTTAGAATEQEDTRTEQEKEIEKLIEKGNCTQIIFTGAPGTGKTYIARHIAESMGAQLTWIEKKDDKKGPSRCEFVQFHPSYDYTDFVEGLRPVVAEEGGSGVAFRKVDGIFKGFCREVAKKNEEKAKKKDDSWKEDKYFFIIDEINRANLSKVFGELMFCLERDKRGPENGVQTQYRNLDTYAFSKEKEKFVSVKELYQRDIFEKGFYIPENVVIIGTMNDIDRSVDTMDFALRRRFEWREFKVTKDSLTAAFAADSHKRPVFGDAVKENAGQLAKAVMALNGVISEKGKDYGLNEHYYISQGQFANLPDEIPDDIERDKEIDRIKQYVWKYRIESLLKEYLRGVEEETLKGFIKAASDAFGVVSSCEEEIGAATDEGTTE